MFSSYQELYNASKSMEFIVRKRLDMVHMAYDSGYKPTARFYNTDRNTVRKWVRRYQLEGMNGLVIKNHLILLLKFISLTSNVSLILVNGL